RQTLNGRGATVRLPRVARCCEPSRITDPLGRLVCQKAPNLDEAVADQKCDRIMTDSSLK
ncbi:hypothetical protein, partial [Nostoc piscinale]|uniref:hypothetical protein n=1 Tax=Nostoc piscinale TaxID=224012 RepID=UPI0039A54AC1